MEPKKRNTNPLRRALWLIPVVTLLAGLGWFENKTLRTETYELVSSHLPEVFDHFRVVQLSDLHGAQFGVENRRLLQAVKQLRPDLIALTGDLTDSQEQTEQLSGFLTELSQIAPTYYVTGNHEWGMPRKQRQATFELLKVCGVERLENEYTVLERGGASIVLAGVDDPNGPADQKRPSALVKEIREQQGEDVYILMLAHRNDTLPQWAGLGVDTVLTGHAHGGIWSLPLVGPVFGTHVDLLPDDAEGVYRRDDTTLVVSRGLGQSNKIPFRLGNRPEITLNILRSQG